MSGRRPKPFLGIHFACCNVYHRIYANAAGTAFVGWCPRCMGRVAVPIGPEGSKARLFRAS